MRRPCFPNSGSHQHGPPLLGRVRTPPRSPTSTLLCSPPTPSSPFGRRSGRPSPAAYPGAEVLFFTAAPVPPLTGATPETFLPRLPISRLSTRGDTRVSQVPGPSSSCVPWSYDPAGCDHPSPVLGEVAVAFRRVNTLGTRKHVSFVATYPRPTRSRAYASPNPLPSPAQGSLPAGRAHPWPGGFRTRWMTNKVSWGHRILHSPLDQPCLVALVPKLIIINELWDDAWARHCHGDRTPVSSIRLQRGDDHRVTRIGGFGRSERRRQNGLPARGSLHRMPERLSRSVTRGLARRLNQPMTMPTERVPG